MQLPISDIGRHPETTRFLLGHGNLFNSKIASVVRGSLQVKDELNCAYYIVTRRQD